MALGSPVCWVGPLQHHGPSRHLDQRPLVVLFMYEPRAHSDVVEAHALWVTILHMSPLRPHSTCKLAQPGHLRLVKLEGMAAVLLWSCMLGQAAQCHLH